jgi:hypothetical protein
MTLPFDNVTIIIEGTLYSNIDLHNTLQYYTSLCHVVLTIFKTDINVITDICKPFPSVTIIENDINDYRKIPVRIDQQFKNHTAMSLLSGFFQICSVKKALECVNTEYVVKTKIDHFYGGMDKFIKCGLLHPDKITSSSLFHRGCQDKNVPNRSRFCLTDTLFIAKTISIKKCFDLCYDNKLLTRVATGIWTPYFIHIFKEMNIDICTVDDELYVKYMNEIVNIYNVNDFAPYKFKYFDQIRNYMHDTNKTTYEYLMYGCDC